MSKPTYLFTYLP